MEGYKKGFTFGYKLDIQENNTKNPGPGSYNVRKSLAQPKERKNKKKDTNNLNSSISNKEKTFLKIIDENNEIGPGSYNIDSSMNRSIILPSIGKSKRNELITNQLSRGPASYNISKSLIFDQKKSISLKSRNYITDFLNNSKNDFPGPGAYSIENNSKSNIVQNRIKAIHHGKFKSSVFDVDYSGIFFIILQ